MSKIATCLKMCVHFFLAHQFLEIFDCILFYNTLQIHCRKNSALTLIINYSDAEVLLLWLGVITSNSCASPHKTFMLRLLPLLEYAAQKSCTTVCMTETRFLKCRSIFQETFFSPPSYLREGQLQMFHVYIAFDAMTTWSSHKCLRTNGTYSIQQYLLSFAMLMSFFFFFKDVCRPHTRWNIQIQSVYLSGILNHHSALFWMHI